MFLFVVAYCPTPTPGPPWAPCQGVPGNSRPPHKGEYPPRASFKAGLSETFPEGPHLSRVLRRVASSLPPGPPGDSRVPTRVRDLSQNVYGLSLSPALSRSHSLVCLGYGLASGLPPGFAISEVTFVLRLSFNLLQSFIGDPGLQEDHPGPGLDWYLSQKRKLSNNIHAPTTTTPHRRKA